MNLEQLQSFLAIARDRSFTRAARELRLTQPGISRQIQRLEQELGVLLLQRHRGSLQLTSAGEHLLVYAEETLSRHRQLLSQLRDESAGVAGALRIAASTTPGEFIVPDLVARFTALYPEVEPEVFTTDSAQVVEELRERRWDIGFVGVRLQGREARGLRYDVVAEDEVVLAVPISHPFAARGEVAFQELAGQSFLEREGGSGTLRSVRAILARQGLALPAYRMAMGVNSTRAILSGAERGYGMGWVSSLALGPSWAGRLAAVRLTGLPLHRQLYMVQERQRPLPPAATAFADWVRREVRDVAPTDAPHPRRSG